MQQCLTMIDPIVSGFESNAQADCLHIDVKKVFDTVPQNELLLKLWRIGITGILWISFHAYISQETVVSIAGKTLKAFPELSGVPQGSFWSFVIPNLYYQLPLSTNTA